MSNNTSITRFCFNASEDVLTDEMWHLEETHETSKFVLAFFFILICVIGLPWNLMVIVTVVKEKLYKDPSIVLLLNLVVSDLFALLLVLPLYIAVGLAQGYIIGNNDLQRCKICRLGILEIIFPITLVYAMALLSFDRFIYFYKPMKYNSIITIPRLLLVISMIWVSAIIIAAMPFYDVNVIQIVFYRTIAACTVASLPGSINIFNLVRFTAISLPIIVLIVCNVWMICIVQKTIREVYNVKKFGNNEGRDFLEKMKQIRRKKQFKLLRVFGGIFLCSALSFLPAAVFLFLSISEEAEKVPIGFQASVFVSFYAQTAIHPILESTLIRDVKEPLKKKLCFCCSKVSQGNDCNCSCLVESDHCCTDFCGKLKVFHEISAETPAERDDDDDDVSAPVAIKVEPHEKNNKRHCSVGVEINNQNHSNEDHLTIKLTVTASSSLTSNATSECHAQNNRNHCSVGVGKNPLNHSNEGNESTAYSSDLNVAYAQGSVEVEINSQELSDEDHITYEITANSSNPNDNSTLNRTMKSPSTLSNEGDCLTNDNSTADKDDITSKKTIMESDNEGSIIASKKTIQFDGGKRITVDADDIATALNIISNPLPLSDDDN